MNPSRFLRKCLTDPPAAWRSLKLVGRSLYGSAFWTVSPKAPLRWRLAGGGRLWLHPGHSFTHCFWPAIDGYEPDVRTFIETFLRPGQTFLDCGANVGYFSIVAGHRVGPTGRVLAVEANPTTFGLLSDNLRLNGFGDGVHCALTNEPGDVTLHMSRAGGDVYSSLRREGINNGQDVESFVVPGRLLDDVLADRKIDRVDMVKVDIEGAELDVLRSAPRLMEIDRPLIICEYGMNTWPAFGASFEQLLAMLEVRNYAVGVFDTRARRVVPPGPELRQSAYANLILFPEERRGELMPQSLGPLSHQGNRS